MRNLKKILALALALVMSMSLMATANAFSDDEQITDTYETAVTVLSGLKVFQGYDDGSFQPQGAITRAEVAAIIYRIVTGDVGDTQVGIYADYNKFDDVKSTSWYAGYVNFCANAEYIKGYDAKTFGPNDPVTGYQALAMILRALGYDKNGEFTGTNWQVQTAAVGENRGITKNITAGTLGVAATREVVAEILFRAILVDVVNYTPAFGYQIGDTSLGYKTFGLEDITGVVVANEYADLYSASPMDEGETELNVDGESYTLAYATTVEDLGEARHAYVAGSKVLAIADAGNTVWTNEGAEADISSNSKFEDVTALEKGDAEEYINFGGDGDAYESEYRIEYVLKFNDADALADFEKEYGVDVSEVMGKGNLSFEKSIRPGNAITEDDLTIIKAIFNDADLVAENAYIVGEVYVGTQSTKDISDEISYRAFYNEYITEVGDSAEVNGADNGEWLKVVDNDGDGEADYIFRIDFAMSVIERISKDDEYTLAELADEDEVFFTEIEIDGSEIKTEAELAEGDVVIYTLIDGNYYMSVAEMVTETVDKKGINSKTETMTCDGTDYVQSHIGYGDADIYYSDVTDAHTEETYDLYLDHFGYVRLFVEADYNVFMLLTDGWYEDDNRNETFQAYYWDVEADEEALIDVVANDYASEFIADRNPTGWNGDVETWGRLFGADWTYLVNKVADWNRVYASNIAGYSETSDGYALAPVGDSTNRVDYGVQAFTVDGLKDRYLDAIAGSDIQTTTNTQYYLVIRSADNRTVSGWSIDDVITWTGYANAPDEAALADGAVGYAVTHDTKTAGSYNVADVVVFETVAYDDYDTYFVYERNNYSNNREYVWGVGYDEEGAIADQRLAVETTDVGDMIEFYEIYDNEVAELIDKNYAASRVYAGIVDTGWDIEDVDYIQVNQTAAGKLYIEDKEDVVIYGLAQNSKGIYSVEEMDRDDVNPGDAMILFTDKDKNVEYAIWVGPAVMLIDTGDIADCVAAGKFVDLNELWYNIVVDAQGVDYDTLLATALYNAKVALDANEKTALENALKELNALWNDKDAIAAFDKDQIADLKAAIEDVQDALDALDTEINTMAIATDLVAAHKTYQAASAGTTQQAAALKALHEAATKYYNNKAAVDAAIAGDTTLKTAVGTAATASYTDVNTKITAVQTAAGSLTTWANLANAEAALDALTKDMTDLFYAYQGTQPAGSTAIKTYEDAVAAIEKALADTAEVRGLMQDVIDAVKAESEATTDAAKAAAKAAAIEAYQTIENSTTLKTQAGTLNHSAYTTAASTVTGWISADGTAKVAAAKTALTGKTWTAIVGTDLDEAAVKANLKTQVEAVLAAANVTGVTVSFSSVGTIPTQGAAAADVTFQIDLKCGNETDNVASQTVNVTNKWTNASLTEAVRKAVAGVDSVHAGDDANDVETAVRAAIGSFGLTDIRVTVELGTSVVENSTVDVSVVANSDVGEITVNAKVVVGA